MTIKYETTSDLILLIQQKAQDYMDLKSELAERLNLIRDLMEQLESRIPLLSAFTDTRLSIEDDKYALGEVAPEVVIESLDRLRKTYEDYLAGKDLDGR